LGLSNTARNCERPRRGRGETERAKVTENGSGSSMSSGSNHAVYVSYDVKGIQQQIFSAPRLKYIVGASALVHALDSKTVPDLAAGFGAEHIFGGGGRGLFLCPEKDAEQLVQAIRDEVHRDGFDLRIGVSPNASTAMLEADRLFGYVPPAMAGQPCTASGKYPVSPGAGKGSRKSVHPVIWARLVAAESDSLGSSLLQDLRAAGLPSPLVARRLTFLRNVSPDPRPDEDSAASVDDGRAGQKALGSRNRWAVICLDGNDIGAQHRETGRSGKGADAYLPWLRAMSKSLFKINRKAMVQGILAVIGAWGKDLDIVSSATRADDTVVLPVRPLILGGDDAAVLCHASHALSFVRAFCRAFERESSRLASDHLAGTTASLWPATGNRLTTSAGVLFVKTTYPLHSAMLIAENLLAMAKHRGRSVATPGSPAPSAVDWETITESFVDHPAARRQRELVFFDQDINREVRLTARPYLLSDLDPEAPSPFTKACKLLDHESVPRTLGARLFQVLRLPSAERRVELAAISKRHPSIYRALLDRTDVTRCGEPDPMADLTDAQRQLLDRTDVTRCGEGWTVDATDHSRHIQTTSFLDALLLMEEEHRLSRETAQ